MRGKCVSECDLANHFVSNNSYFGFNTPFCSTCSSDCLNCEEGLNGPTCVECPFDGVTQFYGYDWYCVDHCPIGSFRIPNSRICTSCIDHCDVCSDANTCESCEYGFKFSNAHQECVSICSDPTYYIDPRVTGQNCLPCPEEFNCTRCGFDFEEERPICLECVEGDIFTPDKRCASNC